MAFEGVSGTGDCLGFLGDDCWGLLRLEAELAGAPRWSDTILLTASTLEAGNGGGNGEIDIAEIEAEWAW